MTDHHDVIAAFVDSEPVPAPDLTAALAEPAGRGYFIDLLVLRGLVGDATRATAGARAAAATQRSARPAHMALWLSAVAALVVVGVAAGFFAGRGTLGANPPDRRAATDAVPAAATTLAPAPTHVIRMENGVVWNERSGGN
jgi:hypothetical protein